jgi:AraC family transcriptional regulator, regulatory protein of adaptative response / methylated-DNA-[protein]-cysteine methyltransferase
MDRTQTTSPARNGAMWEAIQRRDRSADGQFVYAVRSTGIYCRPSCPSRKPGRKQVLFFTLPQAAEGKGFRPCLRCRPRTARIRDPRIESILRVCREIESRIRAGDQSTASLTLAALGAASGMKGHQLERAFRSVIGITPRQYADAQRMLRLKSRLKKGDNVTTALYGAGFGSSSRLYERAPGHLGMTPAAYRQGGAGMRINYTVVDSPLGRLLVGATTRGISALYLGESDDKLEVVLRKEYPRAELACEGSATDALSAWVEKVVAHLRGHEPNLDLPTDVKATAFQRRVWEELRRIPYGCTRTYTQIAHRIGRPTAARAVARACATNPVSVVVPCHRVVREDGNLAGYRWGIDRKRVLLEHESDILAARKITDRVKGRSVAGAVDKPIG